MDKWILIGFWAILAVVQFMLFEAVRRKQKLVIDELSGAPQIDRTVISNHVVEQALSTIWQRTCLRRISIMAPMLGVVLSAAGFLTIQDRVPFDVRQGQEVARNSFVWTLGPLYYGVLIGAVSALCNQILVLILDVQSQALSGHLWMQMAAKRSDLQTTSTSRTTIQNSDDERLRMVKEIKDSLIEAMTQITGPVNQTANRLLEAGTGLAETQTRLQESITRFVTSTGEASLRLQETANSFLGAEYPFRAQLEGVIQSLEEIPSELQKVTTVLTSSLQCLVEQHQLLTGQVKEPLAPISNEPCDAVTLPAPAGNGMYEQRKGIDESLVELTSADGAISPEKFLAPAPAYLVPPSPLGDLVERLRAVSVKSEPITSDNPVIPQFRLDHERIHAIQTETAQVTQFLREVMRDPETEPSDLEPNNGLPQAERPRIPSSPVPTAEVVSRINPSEIEGAVADCLSDLSKELREFVRAASSKKVWNRLDLDQLSRQHRVMLGSAIERVNEWSYDRLGDALFIEDNETFLVQVDLLP